MTKVISALYGDFAQAQRAVDALASAGFDRDVISMVAHDASRAHDHNGDTVVANEDDVKSGEGATFGVVAGALIGLGALLIPGIGPVIAGGPLIAALIGGGIGAVAGGITGGVTASLVKIGVDEETADYYAEGIKRGGTLVTVSADDAMAQRAADTLDEYNPVDRDERETEWRAAGWTRFGDAMTGGMVAPVAAVNTAGMPMVQPMVPVIDHVGMTDGDASMSERASGRRVNVHTYMPETPVKE
ncbi:MAG: general stress protein [Chloroflexota bacterium]|nr:general stress protein [Chloroflexota bacterium]